VSAILDDDLLKPEAQSLKPTIVDAFGLLCPMPIIKAGEALRKLPGGALIELISTDPGVVPDMKDWCKANRHEYLGETVEGRVWKISVRKRI